LVPKAGNATLLVSFSEILLVSLSEILALSQF